MALTHSYICLQLQFTFTILNELIIALNPSTLKFVFIGKDPMLEMSSCMEHSCLTN